MAEDYPKLVRLTINPDKLVEVKNAASYLDLKRWGFIIEDEDSASALPTPSTDSAPAEKKK